jgi:hypothetical protein
LASSVNKREHIRKLVLKYCGDEGTAAARMEEGGGGEQEEEGKKQLPETDVWSL